MVITMDEIERSLSKVVKAEFSTFKAESDIGEKAKVAEDTAKMEDQLAYLKEEVERLQSQDYRTEIVKDFLNQDFEDADPVVKAELGRKLGLTKMFEEAELVEELPETVAEAEEPAPKPGIVYDDPKDEAAYRKVKNLPIWILQKEEA